MSTENKTLFPDVATLATVMNFLCYHGKKYLIEEYDFSAKKADFIVNITLVALYLATCEFSPLRLAPLILSTLASDKIPQAFKTPFAIAGSFFSESGTTITAGMLGGAAGMTAAYHNFP